MDTTRFDAIARLFAGRLSRRRPGPGRGGPGRRGLAAAGLAARRPEPPRRPHPPAPDRGRETDDPLRPVLPVRPIAPKEGADGRYTLTLEQGLGQTVYFSDRPDRIVGASPTPQFLEGLGFPAKPAQRRAGGGDGGGRDRDRSRRALHPGYDEATRTATYEVEVLAEWEDALGVGFTETPADLAASGAELRRRPPLHRRLPRRDRQCYAQHGAHYVGVLPGRHGGFLDASSPASIPGPWVRDLDLLERPMQRRSAPGCNGNCDVTWQRMTSAWHITR